MRTIQKNIYNFKELNKDIQEKVLDKFRENHEFENDFIFQEFLEKVKEELDISLDLKDFYWSIMSRDNQFSLKQEDILKAFSYKYTTLLDLDIPSKFGVYTNYLGGGVSSGLNLSEIKEDCASFERFEEDDAENLEITLLSKKLYDDLIKLQGFMRDTYKRLYEEYNYQMSDEYIKDIIEINEYEFDDEGVLI